MNSECPGRARVVIGLVGEPLTIDNLPSPETKYWVVRRKAEVVAAVHNGLIGLDEACERYQLSVEEFLTWKQSIAAHGFRGLRVKRIQEDRRFYP